MYSLRNSRKTDDEPCHPCRNIMITNKLEKIQFYNGYQMRIHHLLIKFLFSFSSIVISKFIIFHGDDDFCDGWLLFETAYFIVVWWMIVNTYRIQFCDSIFPPNRSKKQKSRSKFVVQFQKGIALWKFCKNGEKTCIKILPFLELVPSSWNEGLSFFVLALSENFLVIWRTWCWYWLNRLK